MAATLTSWVPPQNACQRPMPRKVYHCYDLSVSLTHSTLFLQSSWPVSASTFVALPESGFGHRRVGKLFTSLATQSGQALRESWNKFARLIYAPNGFRVGQHSDIFERVALDHQ